MRSTLKALPPAALLSAAIVCGSIGVCMAQDNRAARPAQFSINFNFVIPAAEGHLHSRIARTDETRRAIYELLARECEHLLATVAATCQISNANVGFSEQRHNQPSPYVQINGSGNFAITLKGKP